MFSPDTRLSFGRPDAPALIGLGVLLFALAVMAGWLARAPSFVHTIPGAVMVFNTALCFALTGAALAGGSMLPPAWRPRWQALLGGAVALGGAIVLAEHLLRVDAGIDWPDLHRWFFDDNPHPGRMSPPTAVAFVLTGVVLLAMQRVRALWSGLVVQGLTILVVAMGIVGAAGWVLKLNLVYRNYLFGQMALSTSLCFMLTGIALWLSWRRKDWYRLRMLVTDEGRHISVNAAVILAIMISASLLAGFAVMERQLDEFARNSLLDPLKNRVNLFRTTIELRTTPATLIATRPTLAGLARRLAANPDDAAALGQLRTAAQSFLPLGFSAIAFESREGTYWAGAGRFVEHAELELPLAAAGPLFLLWDEGFVMKARLPMVSDGETVGVLVAEQRLHALTNALEYSHDFAATGDIALCGRREGRLSCFPRRGEPRAFTVAYSAAAPMGRALAGATGLTTAPDGRGAHVIAAYGPVGGLGLGMVVTMDTAELYAPLREQMYVVLMLMAAMVAAGGLLLYWRIAPLAHRLAVGEQRLKLALESSGSAVWDLDLRSGEVYLSEQWAVLLGAGAQAKATTLGELEKLVHPEDLPLVRRKLRAAVKSDALQYDVEHRVRDAAGKWLWIHSIGRVTRRDAQGRALRMIGVNTNVTSGKEADMAAERHARSDALTGLASRSVFDDRLQLAMTRVRRVRAKRPLLGLMYLNIAGMRPINDNFGRGTGSALLSDFAHRLAGCVRVSDTVARLEGDRFAIVLEDLPATEQGCAIAERVLAAMKPVFTVAGHALEVGTSIGLAFYDGVRDVSPEQLLGHAQHAMYEAYNEGPHAFLAAN